jgi:copper(I)-binding protein
MPYSTAAQTRAGADETRPPLPKETPMRTLLAAVCLVAGMWAPAIAIEGGEARVGGIAIRDAFASATLGNVPNSAAYMTIEIEGEVRDRLVAVRAEGARSAQLHTHIMEGDVAKMRPIDAIELAPGEPVVLRPGGLHVMIMGLDRKLAESDSLALTLVFEAAGQVGLDLPIRSALRPAGGHDAPTN